MTLHYVACRIGSGMPKPNGWPKTAKVNDLMNKPCAYCVRTRTCSAKTLTTRLLFSTAAVARDVESSIGYAGRVTGHAENTPRQCSKFSWRAARLWWGGEKLRRQIRPSHRGRHSKMPNDASPMNIMSAAQPPKIISQSTLRMANSTRAAAGRFPYEFVSRGANHRP